MQNYSSSNYRKHMSRNPLQRALIARFQARIGDLIAPLSASVVLDAGCGEGFVMRQLAQEHPALRVYGTDLDPSALAMARSLQPGSRVLASDLSALPFSAASFDLVVCTEVLEHLDEPDRALAEFERVTRRYCLLTVPWEPAFSIANFLRGKNLSRWGNDEGHVQRWSMHAFARLVRPRFDVRVAVTSFPWTIVLAEKRAVPGG